MANAARVETCAVSADERDAVRYEAPDGRTYELDPGLAAEGRRLTVEDQSGRPVRGCLGRVPGAVRRLGAAADAAGRARR